VTQAWGLWPHLHVDADPPWTYGSDGRRLRQQVLCRELMSRKWMLILRGISVGLADWMVGISGSRYFAECRCHTSKR